MFFIGNNNDINTMNPQSTTTSNQTSASNSPSYKRARHASRSNVLSPTLTSPSFNAQFMPNTPQSTLFKPQSPNTLPSTLHSNYHHSRSHTNSPSRRASIDHTKFEQVNNTNNNNVYEDSNTAVNHSNNNNLLDDDIDDMTIDNSVDDLNDANYEQHEPVRRERHSTTHHSHHHEKHYTTTHTKKRSKASDHGGGGSSCHQCKSRRSFGDLTYCTSSLNKKNKNATCRKKYCEHCLKKFYREPPAHNSQTWRW